ncbi:aldo/keto reductase [[Actinomadura] parvosata subsp. kistnae]|uniref:Aldo/keto reductase n=1 Tax=[Actinomadura] parvosata subsp. kistnae TaxID=1909395 RepID=A0A1U9ZVE4_9ACTN|nr:aldo/keto reductase [Nonomuraea sp. ATCC 55076]AQZ61907.1 aldo/keto reductase [Nonomuraea sp. ATCC 55076]
MRERRFGRLGWKVSEVGYGMWGIAGGEGGWTGADDATGDAALDEAVRLGCTFFDTAWIYGRGHSERMLGRLLERHPDRRLHLATKPPPKDRTWPSTRDSKLADVYPPDHLWEYLNRSLEGLALPSVDLFQFHVWEDSWAHDPSWQDTVTEMKDRGLIGGVGISVNRWEPWNVLRTLETGLIDAVQVIYNIFDQAPEDELFPACRELDVAVIARVPFDEGTLTGTLTRDSRWPEGDWRNTYFVPENLVPSVERAERLARIVPEGMTMPELALRFILANPDVATVIPGMRKPAHVRANLATSDAEPLSEELMAALREHRWDRRPTEWSQ